MLASRAREEEEEEEEEEDDWAAKLRQELSTLSTAALRSRALADGVTEAALDAACKSAYKRLILRAADAEEDDEMVAEYSELKLKELRELAKTFGVEAAMVREAMESDDPKLALARVVHVAHGVMVEIRNAA